MEITPRQDGAVLHFLKEVPGWFPTLLALWSFTVVFLVTRDDSIPRMLDLLLGGFLGATLNQVRRAVQAGNTIRADELNTESMDSANITTDRVTTTEKKPK